jgi:hypothetical protein
LELPIIPARKIKASKVKHTGKVPVAGRMVNSEGSIEYAFYSLVRHDPNVKSVLEQPVKIHYKDSNGKKRHYTPDALVQYYDNKKPLLVEIKSTFELEQHAEKYAERFEAARVYAKGQGWEFQVLTEVQIRGVRLENLEFLGPYKQRSVSLELRNAILETLIDWDEAQACTVQVLLEQLSNSNSERIRLIPVVWHLVAHGLIELDFDAEITMSSPIKLNQLEV